MKFVYLVLSLVVLFLIFVFFEHDRVDYALGIGSICVQVILFLAAIRFRDEGLPNFDMIVAAEIIIAIGIFSLILGTFLAAGPGIDALSVADAQNQFDFDTLKPALEPFLGGLLSAGVAPLLAAVLRQREVLKYGLTVKNGQDAGSPAEREALKVKLIEVTKALDSVILRFDNSSLAFEAYATKAKEITENLEKSAGSLNTAVGSLQGSVDSLSQTVAAEEPMITRSIESISQRLTAMDSSLGASKGKIDALTHSTGTLVSSVEDTKVIMTGLQGIMGNVQSFINPVRPDADE